MRKVCLFLLYVVVYSLFCFCVGCSTIKVNSEFSVDTQEGKKGNIIPHATYKITFTSKESK